MSCLDGNGNEVDWWFLYKEPNGLRYLSFTSADLKNGRSAFHPLNSNILITDPKTSPVLKTIYHPMNFDATEVWLGWNDQILGDLDAYGERISTFKHAHSKGFYAINATKDNISHKNNDNNVRATIGAYAIMTSLPFINHRFESPALQ